MANYKESTVTGTQWTRCNTVVINNPIGGVPTVQFLEEVVISTPGGVMSFPSDGLRLFDAVNPSREIALLNPSTGEATGQVVTEGFLYAALFSRYIALAAARDAAAVHVPTPAPDAAPE